MLYPNTSLGIKIIPNVIPQYVFGYKNYTQCDTQCKSFYHARTRKIIIYIIIIFIYK